MSEYRAIMAGEKALYSLKEARDILSSASNWGLLDIFGGNGFTGFMKHMKIEKARQVLDRARQDLWEFKNELQYLPAINIDVGGFLTFADFFFDGFLSDIFVQSKISDAKRQLDEAINQYHRLSRWFAHRVITRCYQQALMAPRMQPPFAPVSQAAAKAACGHCHWIISSPDPFLFNPS